MKILISLALAVWAGSAAAYLDPGSGSILVSSLLAVVATGLFVLKAAYYKLASLSGRRNANPKHAYGIVCYSEGSHYWTTFHPLINALNSAGREVTFFTSDSEDTAFDFANDLLSVHFIGTGNRAYARLGFLDADVCILTTPGLDVLQIKKSLNVRRYVHLFHSVADVHTYKLFSFDYYDALLCSGQYQIDSIRVLESARKTPRKELFLTGCLYFDELVEKRRQLPSSTAPALGRRVLVAPTWGPNGLLRRFGESLVAPLLEAGYQVVVRPHPQSYVIENDMLTALAASLDGHPNLTWDRQPDGFASLHQADIMISDISAIVFDYSFVFEKPVITIAFEAEWLGTERFDMPTEAFELTMIDEIGRRVQADEISSLPRIVQEVLDDHGVNSRIAFMRDRMMVNFGHAGDIAARQVLSLTRGEAAHQHL